MQFLYKKTRGPFKKNQPWHKKVVPTTETNRRDNFFKSSGRIEKHLK